AAPFSGKVPGHQLLGRDPSANCTWRKTAILALKRGDLPEKTQTNELKSSAIAIFLQNHPKSCCDSGTEH
ncbi:MAG: hypothetical protein Q4Q30_06695, partial [Eggerthella sp.]|nr:hypothetical protein [Eggerthella sp.]